MLIEKSNKQVKEGNGELTKREITGDFVLLQFAGVDTSKEIITSTIVTLAKEKNHQEAFSTISEEIFGKKGPSNQPTIDYEDICEHKLLEQYIKEAIRLGAPISNISPRQFIKPGKIGKINFRVGDRLEIPSSLMHTISGK